MIWKQEGRTGLLAFLFSPYPLVIFWKFAKIDEYSIYSTGGEKQCRSN